MRKREKVALVGLLAPGLVFAGSSAALAATDEEIADALLLEVVDVLDIEVDEGDLTDTLLVDLTYAISEEVIDQDVVSELSETLDAGVEPDLADSLEENLADQDESWAEESEVLVEGLGLVKREFFQCRAEADGPANECARNFGFRIQAGLAEVELARAEAIQARLGELSGDALAQAEAELLQLQERAQERIVRLEAKMVRAENRGEDVEPLRDSLGKLEDSPGLRQGNGSDTEPGNSQNPNSTNGNQSEAPEETAPENPGRGQASQDDRGPQGNQGNSQGSGSDNGRGR